MEIGSLGLCHRLQLDWGQDWTVEIRNRISFEWFPLLQKKTLDQGGCWLTTDPFFLQYLLNQSGSSRLVLVAFFEGKRLRFSLLVG